MKKEISSQLAPQAIGPYSQAIETEQFIFVSGQLPIDVATGKIPDTIEQQTQQALENIQAILAERGLTMQNVVKTSVFLQNMADFTKMNQIYASYFSEPFPARAAYQVAALPAGALVEIEAIATK